jgi:hypothetical protein
MTKNIVYWTTKNGNKISIDEMTIEHLRNTLKMIVKNNQEMPKTCPTNIFEAYDLEPEEREKYYGYKFHDDECRGNQW